MFFKKKKKDSHRGKVLSKQKEIPDILEIKDKGKGKLDNVPDEIVAKAIKDILSKD
ncbi:MAG: hypothetical protein N4A68_06665 [Maledivibacter sp.]|jgi:hypothetical protein|nr:hypothetical protein [Maledivibacter sp.]